MSFHLDNWQHWELNAQNHVFVSTFSSYRHRRKRDVKLTAGLIRHAIYIVAYTANINSLLIGWLTDWLTDWPTEWQTDMLMDWLTHRLTCWLTDWLFDWLTETVIGILAHSFCHWRTDRLTLICQRADSLTQLMTYQVTLLSGGWEANSLVRWFSTHWLTVLGLTDQLITSQKQWLIDSTVWWLTNEHWLNESEQTCWLSTGLTVKFIDSLNELRAVPAVQEQTSWLTGWLI